MIHHLILASEGLDLHVEDGMLVAGSRRIAIESLGSLQCLAVRTRWSQTALERLAGQCPTVLARWDPGIRKWQTLAITPRNRYVNPSAAWKVARLSPQRATQLASSLLYTKVSNQHQLLRSFDPSISDKPQLKDNSFNRILRLEARYARFFWPRYFDAVATDLFARERRRMDHPLNAALNYGYGFLYHAIEWQCLACGLDPAIGIVHKLRRKRPSLACDLIEPLRCTVELTVMRYWDEMREPGRMAGRFAELMESRFAYKGGRFRLRTIIRLMVESFVQALDTAAFQPFRIDARDACL